MDDEDDCVKSAGGTDSNYDEDAELKQMGSDADDSDDSSWSDSREKQEASRLVEREEDEKVLWHKVSKDSDAVQLATM